MHIVFCKQFILSFQALQNFFSFFFHPPSSRTLCYKVGILDLNPLQTFFVFVTANPGVLLVSRKVTLFYVVRLALAVYCMFVKLYTPGTALAGRLSGAKLKHGISRIS